MLSLVAVAAMAPAATLEMQELTRTFVINLKDPHPVVGTVEAPAPIAHARMLRITEMIVSPASRSGTSLWTEVGICETDGFLSVVLTLQGKLRGTPSSEGIVALALLPGDESVLRRFAERVINLELQAIANRFRGRGRTSAERVGPSPSPFPANGHFSTTQQTEAPWLTSSPI